MRKIHSVVWKSTIKNEHDSYGKINIFPREINVFAKELISRHF